MQYDVFVDYRWGNDSPLSRALYTRLSSTRLETLDRNMNIFIDVECLRKGKNFRNEMVVSIFNSTVYCPIISISGLQRMLGHDPSTVDQFLLCLMASLEFIKSSSSSRLSYILPIFFDGTIEKVESAVPALMSCGDVSDVIPTATFQALVGACQHFSDLSSDSFDDLSTLTVRGILSEIRCYSGVRSESQESYNKFVEKCVNDINGVF